MHGEATPLVSLIIPVYNEAWRLRLCLEALSAATYPREHLEILVVDNGSTEDLSQLKNEYPWIRWLSEPSPGSYRARNKGLEEAQGAVIAFTDSDCQPYPDWVERGVAALTSSGTDVGLVGGAVEVICSDGRRNAVELYELIHAFPQQRYVEELHFGVTANLFVKRRVVETVGTFSERLKSGGDYEWGNRVHAAGFELLYVDDARVRHPARASWREINQKLTRVLMGARDLNLANSSGFRALLRQLARAAVPPVRTVFRATRDPRLAGPGEVAKYAWAVTVMRYLTAWHLLRAKLSGTSPR